ncbi:hypothetical protein NL676_019771 [Syzygium grande]|nr:hypothetical protein NL676_019771 [Syzygium grande]
MRSETLTLVLVNLAGIMERADESLLPGVYKEVGAALHIDPTGLGLPTLVRSVVQSCCYPLAAYLATRHNRARIIALGALLWATATFLVAFSSTFLQVAISRGLNGIGLAIGIPAIQSLVADWIANRIQLLFSLSRTGCNLDMQIEKKRLLKEMGSFYFLRNNFTSSNR